MSLFATLNSNAVIIQATSTVSEISDFTVEYTDTNGNGLLDWDEVDSTTGVTTLGGLYPNLVGTPDLTDIAAYGNGGFTWATTNWVFSRIGGIAQLNAAWFTYVVIDDEAPQPVPTPTTLVLLAMGITALGWRRNRRART